MPTRTAVVLNDTQIPWQDDQILYSLVIPFIHQLKPNLVILNGDITDCYDLSSHERLRPTKGTLDHEKRETWKFLDKFKDIREKVWLGGNHEFRLDRYIARNAPALVEDAGVDFQRRFRTADYGFKFIPYVGDLPGIYNLGKLTVTHGFLVRQHSAITAKAHMERLGGSVLHGHSHRVGFFAKTDMKGTHGAWENGCLCLLNPEYVLYPNWQQAFAVVHYADDGYFNVQSIPILERRLFQYGSERIEVGRRDRRR